MSRQAQPPFKLILHSNGSVDVQAASAEMEEAVLCRFQLRTTRIVDGDCMSLTVDLLPLRMLKSLEEVS